MEAALLDQHRRTGDPSSHESARVALHRWPGKPGQLGEGDHDLVLHAVGDAPQARTKDNVHPGTASDPLPQRLGGLPNHLFAPRRRSDAGPEARQIRMPAIDAVMNAAIDPPIIARNPRRDRSFRRRGAIPPIPPIWIAIDEKLANPERA